MTLRFYYNFVTLLDRLAILLYYCLDTIDLIEV